MPELINFYVASDEFLVGISIGWKKGKYIHIHIGI